MSVDKIRHSHTYCARCAEAERDEWKARAEMAEGERDRAVRAVEMVIARLGRSEWIVCAELSRLLAEVATAEDGQT